MKIREATVLDLSEMVEEGIKFLKFIYPDKKVDKGNLFMILHAMVVSGVVFVAEDKGKVIGGIGGNITNSLWWPEEMILAEVFWWVSEEHRGSSAALRLMKRFIDYGKDNPEIDQVVMSMESISPLGECAYTKRGFILKEKAFVMEV